MFKAFVRSILPLIQLLLGSKRQARIFLHVNLKKILDSVFEEFLWKCFFYKKHEPKQVYLHHPCVLFLFFWQI